MIPITYIYREHRKTNFSIEGIFEIVKQSLDDQITYKDFYFDPAFSRFRNVRNLKREAGILNHITGDVYFLAMGLKGKTNIMTVHDLGHLDTIRKSMLKYLVYKKFWWDIPLGIVDMVTVVSEFTRNNLVERFNYPISKTRLIKNPIKPVFIYHEKKIMNSRPRILMLGTGNHKNLNSLLEAVNGLDVHLDIVGWPNVLETEKLSKYKISHTVYHRLTDEEVFERYKACDILFIASFYEGFGMPIIEAQAVGRPVITSNIGAMKEVGEGSAVMVSPKSVEEIREAIRHLVNDKEYYDIIVGAGKKNALNYHHQTIANQYLQLYKEMI